MSKVLITGGTGLVGKYLTEKLVAEGYEVVILSRNPKKENEYKWDISNGFIDEKALKGISYIIHLAGAGIADKRWTKERKKVLIDSRVVSANLLFKKVKELELPIKGFISASGIGYYGAVTTQETYKEEDAPENDFISKICVVWEASANQFKMLNIPVTILRTGVVLSDKGGALQKINTPGFLSILGSGNQFMPWIHIEDLSNLFIKAIQNKEFYGVFNAVSSAKETNASFTKTLGSVLKKIVMPIKVPSFVLKIVLGELAVILLQGSKISSEKINKYYQFKYENLKDALTSFYAKK